MNMLVHRYHDISCGHRVVGHEGKCRFLHGHNYRFHFSCTADDLDELGRVIDFSAIKAKLCMWLEDNWDHRFLMWEQDPLLPAIWGLDQTVVALPFNPTAERLAEHMLFVVGPVQLEGTGVRLVRCLVEETRKCSAEVVA